MEALLVNAGFIMLKALTPAVIKKRRSNYWKQISNLVNKQKKKLPEISREKMRRAFILVKYR
jgi:hypothetical protein